MHINEFAKIIYDRDLKHEKKKVFDWEYYAIAMAGESGEVLDTLKKIKRGDPGLSKKDVAEEVADVIGFAFLLLKELDVDPEKTLLDKFEKVNRRLDAGGYHARPD